VVRVSFTISEPAEIELTFFDRDEHEVAVIRTPTALPAGRHVLSWDGLDRERHPVARDAYTYTLKAKGKNGGEVIWDLTDLTGGRRVLVSDPSWDSDARELRYKLAEPARVRVRASRENGPVLATIVDSAARLRGKHVEVWRDAARAGIAPGDDVDLSFEFEAVTLSENTVILADPRVGGGAYFHSGAQQ